MKNKERKTIGVLGIFVAAMVMALSFTSCGEPDLRAEVINIDKETGMVLIQWEEYSGPDRGIKQQCYTSVPMEACITEPSGVYVDVNRRHLKAEDVYRGPKIFRKAKGLAELYSE